MKLEKYLKQNLAPLRLRVVCFLIQKDRVLLGQKKEGFGMGNYVGIGGKVEENEGIKDTVVREMTEEISVKPVEFSKMGSIKFYFLQDSGWNQEVIPFVCRRWEGEPVESDEIRPVWFDVWKLPVSEMWDDAKFWIPRILQGEILRAEFLYDKKNLVSDYLVATS